MYKISVPEDTEITLEGMPVDPAEHPVTIAEGANWIGFQPQEGSTVTLTFAGFASNGDLIKSEGSGQAQWNGRMWVGALKNLVPGNGYVYKSSVSENRTFNFPTSSKSVQNSTPTLSTSYNNREHRTNFSGKLSTIPTAETNSFEKNVK